MPTGAIYLTEASVGAPALSGTNGALCALLDWALPQKNWAIEHATGHARVYRPGVGSRHRLFVALDSAMSGRVGLVTIRGAEQATGATMAQLVDPFPTEAQLSDGLSSFQVSNSAGASSVPRPWRMVLSETFLVLAVGTSSSSSDGWDLLLFGDAAGREAGDAFGTFIHVGGVLQSNAGSRAMHGALSPYPIAAKTFWCRSIDGAIKSSRGCMVGSGAAPSAFMSATGLPPMRVGYGGRINRELVAASCIGSSTTVAGVSAVHRRGWVPNVWNPLHTGLGTVTADYEFTDTQYAAGSVFCVIPASVSIAAIIEASDTWSPPNG